MCLISQHPLVLGQLERLLDRGVFQVQSYRLQPDHLLHPDLIRVEPATVHVLDICAIPRITAERLASTVTTRCEESRLIVLSEHLGNAAAFSLLRIGTKGLLTFAQVDQQFGSAVQAVASGGYWVPRSTLSQFVEWLLASVNTRRLPAGAGQLSAREREVLALVLDNLSNKEIADKLHISEATAKFHVSSLLSKYGVQRRADLIVLCYQLSPDTPNGLDAGLPGSSNLERK